MKVLKGRLHVQFGDLVPGETFVFDGSPCMKMGLSGGGKPEIIKQKLAEDSNYLNGVHLGTGIKYHYPKDKRVEKVDLGVTGMDTIED